MTRATRPPIQMAALGLLVLVTTSGAVGQEATDPTLREERMGWSRLTMSASKFFIRTEATLEYRLLPRDEAIGDFVALPEGMAPIPPKSDTIATMDVRNEFLGRDSRTRFWFDATSGQAFQWNVVESGKRERYKMSRVLADGIWVRRKNPAGKSEKGKPHTQWTKVNERVEPFEGLPPGRSLAVSAGLFYVMATAALDHPGDQVHLYLESDERVFPVALRVKRMEQIKVDYERSGPGGKKRVRGKVPALRLSVKPLPPKGMHPNDFKLVGLEGDVDVWLDPEGRYPLQVAGKVAYAGHVKIRIESAELTAD